MYLHTTHMCVCLYIYVLYACMYIYVCACVCVFIWFLLDCLLLSHLSSKALAWKLLNMCLSLITCVVPQVLMGILVYKRIGLKCRFITDSDYFPGCVCEISEQEGLESWKESQPSYKQDNNCKHLKDQIWE